MNKIIKNSGKILISGLLIFSLVGCGKVPVLKNGEEAVVTSDAKNISVTEFYEKIKEKYGVNVLVDMIDEMILSDKYKETTKEEKEYIKEKVKEVEDSAKQYNTTFEYLIAYYYGLESKTEFEKFVSLSYRRNEAVKELVKKGLTDKEIQKYYDENIFGDIRTKHILISIDTLDGMTTEEKNNKEKECYAVLKKDKNGNLTIGIYLAILKNVSTKEEVTYVFKNNESGSSRGLMCALEIYNRITDFDITKGDIIAGTGSIEADGTVGDIDGVKYKIKGAVKNKAKVFIVPSGNYDEALKLKEKNNYDIELIKADNLHNVIENLKNR